MAAGLAAAGFEVVGVDHKAQPRYPFEFIKADALEVMSDLDFMSTFDAYHASPPCQVASAITPSWARGGHLDLIPDTRLLLMATGKPYSIENVEGSSLLSSSVWLCGSSFGLRVRRHRGFEVNFPLVAPPCDHSWQDRDPLYRQSRYHRGKEKRWSGVVGVYGRGCGLGMGEKKVWQDVMEIDWMTMSELAEAIPPIYGSYVGRRMIRHLIDRERSPVQGS
jgi:DNA (cytosine-5)-methyltransferase 1